MENDVIEAANRCIEMAGELKETDFEDVFTTDMPQHVQSAMLKLYYALRLETKLEPYREQLTEESDEQTVNAVYDAGNAIQTLVEASYETIDGYREVDFKEKIEQTTIGSEGGSLYDLLCKLYKCQGLIHKAYQCAAVYPLYGLQEMEEDPRNDTGVIPDLEDFVLEKTDVDICALLEIREKLEEEIGKALDEKTANG